MQKQELCPVCNNHTVTYLRISTWVWFLLPIPLFPVSFKYFKYCELCGCAQRYPKAKFFEELKKTEEPLPTTDPIDLSKGARQITIIRKARSGKGPAMDVYIENQLVAKLEKNQPTITFETDAKPWSMFVKIVSRKGEISDIVYLEEGIIKQQRHKF